MNGQDEKHPQTAAPSPYKPMLFGVLILISGILIGAGLMYIRMQRHIPRNPEPGPEYFSERIMRHMVGELRLTPEQRGQIDPIIKQHFESMHQIRMEARPKISEEIKQMNEAILPVLTEQQKRRWQEQARQIREFPREGFDRQHGPGQEQWRRGPEGQQDRRPPSEDAFRDRRRQRRDEPNMPDRPEITEPMNPVPRPLVPPEPQPVTPN